MSDRHDETKAGPKLRLLPRLIGTRAEQSWTRYLLRHGSASLAFYLVVLAGLWTFQDRAIYPAAFGTPRTGYDENVFDGILKADRIPVRDGSLFALHAVPAAGKPTIVMFHGNGGYPEDYAAWHEGFLREGFGIVAPAMRGYPRSSGSPNEHDILEDAPAVVEWARKTHPGSPIVVLGHSLGCAPAIAAAVAGDVEKLVLVSPFLSMRSVVRSRLPFVPVDMLLDSPFRNDLAIGSVEVPTLILHGTDDWSVPISSGRALSLVSKAPTTFVPVEGAGHNGGILEYEVGSEIVVFVSPGPSGRRDPKKQEAGVRD